MKTTTGPHRSREEHLQGLLERSGSSANEPAWERRGPHDRQIAARNRQLDHLSDQWETKRHQAGRPSTRTTGKP